MTNYLTGHIPINDLIAQNRDLLEACPRPGGYVKFTNPLLRPPRSRTEDNNDTREIYIKDRCYTPNCSIYRLPALSPELYRQTSFLGTCPSVAEQGSPEDWEVCAYEHSPKIETPEEYVEEPPEDTSSNRMLAVTISLVMVLAAGVKRIPEEHFIWAESYLACIKNEVGQHPPNVMGLLNLIQQTQGCPLVLGSDSCLCPDILSDKEKKKLQAQVKRTEASSNIVIAKKGTGYCTKAFDKKVKKQKS